MFKKPTLRSSLNIVLSVAVIGVAVGAINAVTTNQTASAQVRTATVSKGTVLSTVSASGNVQASHTSSFGFQTSGRLAELDVANVQAVSAGQVIARLDTKQDQLSVDSASAALNSAETKLNELNKGETAADKAQNAANEAKAQADVNTAQRNLDSANSKGDQSAIDAAQDALNVSKSSLTATTASNAAKAKIDPTELANDNAAVVSAQSQLNTAQQTLSETTLTAPFSGTVTSLANSVGDYITANGGGTSTGSSSSSSSNASSSSSSSGSTSSSSSTSFVTITDLNSLEVKAGFTETDAAKLKVGQAAAVTFDALPSNSASGRVDSIDSSSTVVSNVVTYYAIIQLQQAPTTLKQGMTASAAVTIDSRDDVLYLPTSAVSTVGNSSTAAVTVVADNGTKTPTTVTLGLKGDDSTEITSGLQQGQKIEVSTTSTGSTSQRAGGPGGGGPPGGGLGGGLGG